MTIRERVDRARAQRASLAVARAELLRVSERDGEETDDYLAANREVAAIEDSMPWLLREWP